MQSHLPSAASAPERSAPGVCPRARLRCAAASVAFGTVLAGSLFGCARGSASTTPTASRVASAGPPGGMVAATDSTPFHESFVMQSAALGEPRPINVWRPASHGAPDAAALPVLYMPDGGLQEDFVHVTGTVDSLIRLRAIRPVVVVGIPNTQRRRDLTGPTRIASDSAIAPRVGGSAAFRRFIREELMPEVRRRYRTTDERGIMGESLGGLFILETFVQEPALFTHYIALDPSLWWNSGSLVESALARIRTGAPGKHTLYFASSAEPSTATGASKVADALRAATPIGLRWTYVPRTDLTHANIFRTLEPLALVHAFGPQ